MEAEFTANDNALPHDELLALAALLKGALCIEHDLSGQLSRHPQEKSLLKRHKEYRQLVGQLTGELERALARYSARIKAAAELGACTAMGPAGRAAAASRPEGRRTPAR
jgi:hypothetical protein